MQITKTRIIGTNRVILAAWEPTPHKTATSYGHTTIRSDANGWIGRIGTKRPPSHLVASRPRGDNNTPEAWDGFERVCQAADAWRRAEYSRAYAAIASEYPEVDTDHFAGRITRDRGEIVIDPYNFDTDGELDG